MSTQKHITKTNLAKCAEKSPRIITTSFEKLAHMYITHPEMFERLVRETEKNG